MGDVAVTIAKWALRLTFVISVLLGIIVLVAIVGNYLSVALNLTVLFDLFALLQIWLPFNLNVLLIWLSLSSTAYIAYSLSLMAFNLLNAYIGK